MILSWIKRIITIIKSWFFVEKEVKESMGTLYQTDFELPESEEESSVCSNYSETPTIDDCAQPIAASNNTPESFESYMASDDTSNNQDNDLPTTISLSIEQNKLTDSHDVVSNNNLVKELQSKPNTIRISEPELNCEEKTTVAAPLTPITLSNKEPDCHQDNKVEPESWRESTKAEAIPSAYIHIEPKEVQPGQTIIDNLERFKSITRGLTLLAHTYEEIQLASFSAGQIIASYERSGSTDFFAFFDAIFSKNKDANPTAPYNILDMIINGLKTGETDKVIIQHIKDLLKDNNRKEISSPSNKQPTKNAQLKTQHPEKEGSNSNSPNDKLRSLTKKHRALQYSTEIAVELLKSFESKAQRSDFLSYAEATLSPLRTKNTGYILELAKREKNATPIPSSTETYHQGINVSTIALSPSLSHHDSFINDFLYVANAISTMRVKHYKITDSQVSPDKKKGTATVYGKNTYGLYNDLVDDEFKSLLIKDKRFDIVFRMLIFAASRLQKGDPREKVIDELRRFVVKERIDPTDKVKTQVPVKAPAPVAPPFSSEELKLLQAARDVSIIIGNYSLESRMLHILDKHVYQSKGKMAFYKDVVLNRINETSEHLIILEIILILEQGGDIRNTFSRLFSNIEILYRYKNNSKPISEPINQYEKSIKNNVIYRGWNATVSVLSDIYNNVSSTKL